jgi:hypothetical protein
MVSLILILSMAPRIAAIAIGSLHTFRMDLLDSRLISMIWDEPPWLQGEC